MRERERRRRREIIVAFPQMHECVVSFMHDTSSRTNSWHDGLENAIPFPMALESRNINK